MQLSLSAWFRGSASEFVPLVFHPCSLWEMDVSAVAYSALEGRTFESPGKRNDVAPGWNGESFINPQQVLKMKRGLWK
ncbi:hypothetical protein MHYP_G00054940 [Metynnis hypsauchen]